MKLTVETAKSASLPELLAGQLHCTCGKDHGVNTREVVIEPRAIGKIGDALKRQGVRKVLLISDQITWDIAAKQVTEALDSSGIPYVLEVLEGRVIPHEGRVGEIVISLAEDIDGIVAVGTGVIIDLGKLVASRTERPLAAVITAPSVDGFASRHAALVRGELKISYDSKPPEIIIGDIDVLRRAPLPMIMAGWADIMGKFSALSDWQIGRIVNGEYYCEPIAALVYRAVDICRVNLTKIKARDATAVQSLMEALILAGIAMSYIGNSRPASGSEHHRSHCWEMVAEETGVKLPPHGVQVGVGERIMARLYAWAVDAKPDFAAATEKAKNFDERRWEEGVRIYYKGNADKVVKDVQKDQRYAPDIRLKRIRSIEAHWAELQAIFQAMPNFEDITAMLEEAELAATAEELGISWKEVADSVRFAKDVRDKYTLLGLLNDVDLLEDYAERIEQGI